MYVCITYICMRTAKTSKWFQCVAPLHFVCLFIEMYVYTYLCIYVCMPKYNVYVWKLKVQIMQ